MYSYLRKNAKKNDKANIAWEIVVAIIVGIVTCVVTIAVGIWTYNHRYDGAAEASGGVKFSFKSNFNSDACSFTPSAGAVYYGYFQPSGSKNTQYALYYKKNNKTTYSYLKQVECASNNDYEGDYYLTYNRYSQKYDFKVDRKNNKSTTSKFEVDWGIY